MKLLTQLLLLSLFLLPLIAVAQDQPIAIVIHGGAGGMKPGSIPAEKEQQYRQALENAAQVGYQILEEGGSSLDAVQAAIMTLEDNPLFNAGRGAVFTHNEKNELDASIMEGSQLQAGAVAGVDEIRNPIAAARAVMEKSPHVLLVGDGAEAFAESVELELVDPSYFRTEEKLQWLRNRKAREKEAEEQDHSKDEGYLPGVLEEKMGTVGAVALDREGNIAAGTSTGGMTNKRWGRIGDSPIIAAGTYAENGVCGISATGHGEYFIRTAAAYDVCARMKYKDIPLGEAMQEVIYDRIGELGGTGGLIGLDHLGNIEMVFNTDGMFRVWKKEGEPVEVMIYKEQ